MYQSILPFRSVWEISNCDHTKVEAIVLSLRVVLLVMLYTWFELPCQVIRMLWNPESRTLEPGILLKKSGIPLKINIQNPSSTDRKLNPVPGIRNPHGGIQNPRLPWISTLILLHEKFRQFDWLRAVVFQLYLKYPLVKSTNLSWVVV